MENIQTGEELGKLMDDIYAAVGVRVSFTTCAGERLAHTSFQTPFCARTLANREDERRCQECTRESTRLAMRQGGIFSYRCWRGLMSTSIAVMSDGQPVGTFLVSGYITTPELMAETEQILPDPERQFGPEDLKDIQFLRYEKVKDIIKTVSIAAGYLSETNRRLAAEEARRRAEQLQARAEFRALQSQISPHFLFNTLNAISQVAVLEGAEQTPEAIYSLAALLRRTMKQNSSLVTLEEELDFVREYIRILQLAGHSDIRYTEELEPGVLKAIVPAFTVQPLVENAVTHGIAPKEGGGTVSLTVGWDGDRIVVAVTDDGVGFDPELVKPMPGGEMTGVGVANVLQRLRLYYADSFENRVFSAPGEGSTVALHIPFAL